MFITTDVFKGLPILAFRKKPEHKVPYFSGGVDLIKFLLSEEFTTNAKEYIALHEEGYRQAQAVRNAEKARKDAENEQKRKDKEAKRDKAMEEWAKKRGVKLVAVAQ